MKRIRPRRPKFDLGAMPLHWVDGDPQTTHTVNVLSILLPAGEKWFVRVFRQVLPEIVDPSLREDVRGFIGQEALHATAHERVLERLRGQGLDIDWLLGRIDFLFERILADAPLGVVLPARFQRGWLRQRVALIAGIEHYTTVMGNWVIDAEALHAASTDDEMIALLLWHGAEEVEHGAVAFDVLESLGGSYPLRVAGLGVAFVGLNYAWIRSTIYLMARDPSKPKGASFGALREAGARGVLPRYVDLLRASARYLARDHHPTKEMKRERAASILSQFDFLRVA